MHSKIQSYRILEKCKNREKACGLPVVKKVDFRFSRHRKLRLFRSKANLFTRFSNNTAKIRVVKCQSYQKHMYGLSNHEKSCISSVSCENVDPQGSATWSAVEVRMFFAGSLSQSTLAAFRWKHRHFQLYFLVFSILFRLNLTSPFIKQARSKVCFF